MSTVVDSPPTTAQRPLARTRGDAAAATFRRRQRAIDRIARGLIAVSGVGIIGAVLGIGVFLVAETLPLFQGASARRVSLHALGQDQRPVRLVLMDEHQERAAIVSGVPAVQAIALARQETAQTQPLSGLAGHRITAASRSSDSSETALGTDQGTVWIGTVGFETRFDGAQRQIQLLVEPEMLVEAIPGRRIDGLSYRRAGDRALLASVADGGSIIATRLTIQQPLIGPPRRLQESVPLPMASLGQPTTLLVDGRAEQVVVGTGGGRLVRWRVPPSGPAELLESLPAVEGGGVSAAAYLLGDRSIAVGGSDGSVATWSLVRDPVAPDGWRLTRIHTFAGHPAPVTLIAPSPRDKGFVTADAQGTVRLQYMTSERTLTQFTVGEHPQGAIFGPKANGALVVDGAGTVHHWAIENPHPEFSWSALFGKVWYEGYPRPDTIWQSSGGTDDFEPKLSLIPLAFGTLKGTVYAMCFAVPLALFGALYCSQFLDKRLRSPVKSGIELMAALPSVVLGFMAGVVLASLVQQRIVSVLILPVVLPAVAIAGMLACRRIAHPPVAAALRRHEFWVLVGWALIGALAAAWLGPWVERVAFRGDFQGWLLQTTGWRYDQRNSLVVGWAMGFAVIPIIFTICEDAFSAVPRHLVSASLACGASLWQTAWRVVLPAAGSGVFSAVMVGFGRAVGETMIVLMATGNTPVMDWSIFNGFRALSANIAVEIPEAPYGGTLYRVLFVAALLLFAMTSIVNTAAELIRLRLRRQLQGL